MKYVGAISDTDILINLAKVNRLDLLEYLFEQIIIPQYVYDIEIKKKAGIYYSVIIQAIDKENSRFKILDRKKSKALNMLSKDIIDEKKKVIGSGESECAGYAIALRIPIIISDNYTEFKWLEEFITLTHRNVLTLCVYFNKITGDVGKEIFDDINRQLERPTQNTFEHFYKKSINAFIQNGWCKYLGIDIDK